MKKRALKTASVAVLTVAMAAGSLTSVAAATPFWTVDFNNGYDDLQTDENFEVVENGATPELITEEVDGTELTVLKLNQSTGDEVSALWYGAYYDAGYTENSTIKLTNPFSTLGENYFREDWYDEYYDFLATEEHVAKYNNKKQPAWENGATLSYWIKVPTADSTDDSGRTVGVTSSVFTWELQDYQYQADDYAKYLAIHDCQLEIEYNIANGIETNESGVTEDSDYYFEWQYDDEGNVITYTNAKDQTGPIYGSASDIASNFGKNYFCNPNYVQGFQGTDESNYEWMYHSAYASEGYDTLPVITQSYIDTTLSGGNTWDLAEGDSWDVGTSAVRFARTHGSMQIDSTSSVYWDNDDSMGVNRNSNVTSAFGSRAGMQNGDKFAINSWQESQTDQTKESAKTLADSPYSQPDEWHLVTMTFQNDWVEIYMDGESVDVFNNYSTGGESTLDTSKSFKRFNKGSGMRYGYGSEKDMGYIFYGNYVCRLFLDWLTNENVTFTIGGVVTTNANAQLYWNATQTDEIEIASIAAYDVVLTDDEIAAQYAAGITGWLNDEADYKLGDVDENGEVTSSDALAALQAVVELTTLTDTQTLAADVDGNGTVESSDALYILQYVVELIDTFPAEQ